MTLQIDRIFVHKFSFRAVEPISRSVYNSFTHKNDAHWAQNYLCTFQNLNYKKYAVHK